MPGKSRPGKGKYSPQSKKRRKGSPNRPTILAQTQQPAAAQKVQPVPSSRMPLPMVKSVASQDPYIVGELRTIGILAVVMLIILIVLARVLS